MSKANGFFVVIEGPDGSGKSELVRQLFRMLQRAVSNSDDVLVTYEPHDPSCAGWYIRQVLSHRLEATPYTLALAFAVNRADHIRTEMAPFLEKSPERIVLCDRYYMSSLVYQSGNAPEQGLSMEEVWELNKEAMTPDLVVYLDASVKTCYQRMRARTETKELFETKVSRTKQKYEEAIAFLQKKGINVQRVDADGEKVDVLNQTIALLNGLELRWLAMQPVLFVEPPNTTQIYTLNGEVIGQETQFIDQFLARLDRAWQNDSLGGTDDTRFRLSSLDAAVEKELKQLELDDWGRLMLGLLAKTGYRIVEKLPWTDLLAYRLEYSLPLGIRQSGTVVLLDMSARYDIVAKQKLPLIESFSDFMFILDVGRSKLATHEYHRERVQYGLSKKLSPTTKIILSEDIASYIRLAGKQRLADYYSETLMARPELAEILRGNGIIAN